MWCRLKRGKTLKRLVFQFSTSAPASGCFAGDVRTEHPAAAGVDGIARLRRPPHEAWHRRLRHRRPRLSFYPLFFSLIWIVANFQCKPPGTLHLPGCCVQASGTTASSNERCKFAFELLSLLHRLGEQS